MGHLARAAALTGALSLSLGACGDPMIVVGDSPGTLRIIAGVADLPGDSLGPTATESLLDTPLDLAAGEDGTVYIADSGNARVLAVSPSGDIVVLVDHSDRRQEPRLHAPNGLALDGRGGLLIADPFGQRIWHLEIATADLAPVAGTGVRGTVPDSVAALQANLDTPTGVAVAADGRIYFTETGAHRVRRIEADGMLVTIAGTGLAGFTGDDGPADVARLQEPSGLVFGDGVLFIADSGNNRIRAIDLATGLIRTVAGAGAPGSSGDDGPAIEALLNAPSALAVAADASVLYIADTDNHRVRVVNLVNRRISTFAGTGGVDFNGDLLPAGATALSSPQGLAISAFDLLYLSDSGHHIVRRTPVAFLGAP